MLDSCRIGARTMASYFDEHDCEPTNPEEQYRQNALLELARWRQMTWTHHIPLVKRMTPNVLLKRLSDPPAQVSDAGPGHRLGRLRPVGLGPAPAPAGRRRRGADPVCGGRLPRASRWALQRCSPPDLLTNDLLIYFYISTVWVGGGQIGSCWWS